MMFWMAIGLYCSGFPLYTQDRYDPEINRRPYVPDVTKHSANTLDSITAADYAKRNKIKSNMADYKPSYWHINFIFGASYLHERNNIEQFYDNEGYVYHVADLKDPDEKKHNPKLIQISVQHNLSPHWQIEAVVSRIFNQTLAGSNWLQFVNEEDTPPSQRFDLEQKSEIKMLQVGGRYIFMPVNMTTRLELSTGAGIAYYSYHTSSHHYYAQNIGYHSHPQLINQTSSSFSYDRNALGAVADLSLDFYLSPKISCQFRYEKRITEKIKLPSESFEYVIRKQIGPREFIMETHEKHIPSRTIDLSGYTLNMALHLHLF
ncbi:MAG TPA: hypothetical protein PLG25_08115 [bacterium]|nr:hypothetical protein [bacterium]HNE83826.1 hypothetical protein [bacterium]HNO10812.1 hypothetical protein [bacterium]